jgi:hypothetical protein
VYRGYPLSTQLFVVVMCRGEEGAAVAAFSDASSKVKWQLEPRGESWRLAVEAQARPNVDLSAAEIKLELSDGGENVVLTMPPIAVPIEIASASCSYSKKRRELVVQWPRQETKVAVTENVAVTKECEAEGKASMEAPAVGDEAKAKAAEEAAAKAKAEEEAKAKAAEEAAAKAKAELDAKAKAAEEAAAKAQAEETQETGSDSTESPATEEEASASEETGSDAAEETTSTESPAPKESGCTDKLKAEDPVIQEMSAEDWKALGNDAIKKGDHKAALQNYSNGLAVDPDHAMILSNRALCHHKLGHLQEALEDAQRVVALKPDFYKAYIRAAMVLRELKRPQEAMATLKRRLTMTRLASLSPKCVRKLRRLSRSASHPLMAPRR